MVHDSIAEELEAKGFYRRAAARWAEVMMLVETDRERERVAMRRAECYGKTQRPPEQPDDLCGLKRAIKRTEKEMGIDGRGKKIWRSYQK